MKKTTGVGDVCTSVGDQEKVLCMLVYRDQSTGALGQSTGGCPGVLCRFSAGISRLLCQCSRLIFFPRVEQSTDMPVSRLVLSRNLHQSTGCLDQSTDRLGRVLERCFKRVSTKGINSWGWCNVLYVARIVPRGYKRPLGIT